MGEELTIDELAYRTGLTTRNVRAYQERGLLPPPVVRGRVGYYGDGHVARLRHIGQLAERGFSQAAIRALFEAWERGLGLAQVLGFEEALGAPWQHQSEQVLTAAQLIELFGGDQDTITRAVDLLLLDPLGDGRYRVNSPALLQAGAALIEAGVPLDALLDEAEALQADLDRVAGRFVALFMTHVWQPYVTRGMAPGELAAVTRALERLRPVAGMAVDAVLAGAMERRVRAVSAETLASTWPAGGDDAAPDLAAGVAAPTH